MKNTVKIKDMAAILGHAAGVTGQAYVKVGESEYLRLGYRDTPESQTRDFLWAIIKHGFNREYKNLESL